MDARRRLILTNEGFTTQRWRKFRELFNQRIVRQRARIEFLERIKRLQFLNEHGELKDKMIQTKLTFDTDTTPPTRTAGILPDHECGAWDFRSSLNTRL